MDAATRAQIAAAVASLSLPWNAECVRGGIRHLARNVDHDDYSSVEEEHNCPNRQDGGAIALIVNNAPALLAAAQEVERLRERVAFWQDAHEKCHALLTEARAERDRLTAEAARLRAALERVRKHYAGDETPILQAEIDAALRGQP